MKYAFVVIGLGFGDEGKGSIVDFLVRKFKASHVIRFNGGPQAAHHVVLPDGIEHTFSHFGSGSFNTNVKTFISKEMVIQPLYLLREAEVLKLKGIKNIMDRIFIDQECFIVTPLHKMIGRILEVSRGQNRHSSTGLGVGQTFLDKESNSLSSLQLRDFSDNRLDNKVTSLFTEKFKKASELIDKIVNRTIKTKARDILIETQNEITEKSLIRLYRNFGEIFKPNIVEGNNYLHSVVFNNNKSSIKRSPIRTALFIFVNNFVLTSMYITLQRNVFNINNVCIKRIAKQGNNTGISLLHSCFTESSFLYTGG